jgi:hypothetical protein
MKSNYKPSISSRTSVRSLIVACLPGAGLAFVANSPALGAAFAASTNRGLTVDGNNDAGTNTPTTNHAGKPGDINTNGIQAIAGIRG